MDKEIFSDGIGKISVIGGVVRADLVTFLPPESDSTGQPQLTPAGRLVMGVEAFIRSSEKMQEAVQAIIRAQQSLKPGSQPTIRPNPSVQPFPVQQKDVPSADRIEAQAQASAPPFP